MGRRTGSIAVAATLASALTCLYVDQSRAAQAARIAAYVEVITKLGPYEPIALEDEHGAQPERGIASAVGTYREVLPLPQAAESALGQVIDTRTGVPASIARIENVKWTGWNRFEVRAGWHGGPKQDTGEIMEIAYSGGKWTVVAVKEKWVAQTSTSGFHC